LNLAMRERQLRWLAQAAEGVIARTDPRRLALDATQMALERAEIGVGKLQWRCCFLAPDGLYKGRHSLCSSKRGQCPRYMKCCCILYPTGAKATSLLERRPWLAPLLLLLANLMVAAGLYAVGLYILGFVGSGAGWSVLGLWTSAVGAFETGWMFQRHQAQRQLLRPAVCGDCMTRHSNMIFAVLLFLSAVLLPVYVMATFDGHIESISDETHIDKLSDSSASSSSGRDPELLWNRAGLSSGLCIANIALVLALAAPLHAAQAAATERASLCVKAGWLRLRLGEASTAVEILKQAHAQLLRTIGCGDVDRSWLAAPALARALVEAGRPAEAAGVRRRVEDELVGLKGHFQSHNPFESNAVTQFRYRGFSRLLRAGMAAAVRAPDSEVLGLLAEAAENRCWVPAGSRWLQELHYPGELIGTGTHTGNALTEGWLPEWKEFLDHMAEARVGAAGTTAEGVVTEEEWQQWEAYATATIKLARQVVRLLDHDGLNEALESRCLPPEGRRYGVLLASLFEHPAWGYSSSSITEQNALGSSRRARIWRRALGLLEE
jgi:hypothetical protein